jgi:hypothetical protein
MKRVLICSCLLLCAVDPSPAQQAKAKPAFYIIFNSLTKKCTVVDRMPQTDTPNISLATDAIYSAKAEAEDAIKKVKACNG